MTFFISTTLSCRAGVTLPGAKLAYKTFGALSPTKDNVIVFPRAYIGLLAENEVARCLTPAASRFQPSGVA
jgi:homoserine acetyltransferase